MKKLSKSLSTKLTNLQNKCYNITEKEFNLNSPKQLSEIFFNEFNPSAPSEPIPVSKIAKRFEFLIFAADLKRTSTLGQWPFTFSAFPLFKK